MRHTLPLPGRCLAAVLFTAIGLGAYGCGDSATVSEPAELGNLSVSPGTLQPTFNPSITDYKVQLSSDVTAVTINASPRVAGDTVRIDNQSITSKTIFLPKPGTTIPVSIVVTETGAGGGSQSYTVHLTRANLAENNSLQKLTVSPKPLEQPFDKNTLLYTVSVDNAVTSVEVTPTLDDPAATMTVNGAAAISDQATKITLNDPGKSTTTPITIVVTAQNGNQKNYVVSVSRGKSGNNNLQSLTLSPGTLKDPFTVCTVACTLNVPSVVPSGVTNVTVTPELADPTTATMTVNGQATTNKQARTAPLPTPGSSNSITIVVTAQNGTQQTYTVGVVRAPLGSNNNLSALSVNASTGPQTLSPPFDAGILPYTVNVPSSVNEVTVSATKADRDATMAIGSVTVQPGAPTGQTTVPVNTTLSIAVTAQSGGPPRTYTIDVIRAAPAAPLAPTSAPDLIDADDPYICIAPDPFDPNDPNACDPTKSDATTKDNITNVTKPGFSILPPSAGETAKLYIKDINGKEFPSSLDSNNTFRPNDPLPEGGFNITYTLSNSGGESAPSPALRVTIDTGGIAPPPPPPTQ